LFVTALPATCPLFGEGGAGAGGGGAITTGRYNVSILALLFCYISLMMQNTGQTVGSSARSWIIVPSKYIKHASGIVCRVVLGVGMA
jgi:hypothetical protein